MKLTIHLDITDPHEEITSEEDLKSALKYALLSGTDSMDLIIEDLNIRGEDLK